ncbi:hypothetical protein AYJ54_40255 [Bradyrhizobium centrolobii]|uniref:Uncharacterized protein n=1 Tax=Bradyrhizobium centrolobii TaxID=1505087 RepID=A0A176Z750_9BRAD|nr:hypothetical protein AYJ54_40255 [Bradyrhizobium centrolobii]
MYFLRLDVFLDRLAQVPRAELAGVALNFVERSFCVGESGLHASSRASLCYEAVPECLGVRGHNLSTFRARLLGYGFHHMEVRRAEIEMPQAP